MESAADLQREYVDAFNRRDWARARDLIHPEYVYIGSDGSEEAGGPEVALAIKQMCAGGFPDARWEIRRQYEQDDSAIAEVAYSGNHGGEFMGIPATGKRIQGPEVHIIQARDGKIYREREYFDVMHLMSQLGLVEMPAGAVAG